MKKKKSPSRKCKKKKTPQQVASDTIYEAIINAQVETNSDTINVSNSIKQIRAYDIKKDSQALAELSKVTKKHSEIFIKGILDDLMDSELLSIMDISLMADMLSLNLRMLPLWCSQNKVQIEDMLYESGLFDDLKDANNPNVESSEEGSNMGQIFEAMKNSLVDSGDCDGCD